MPGRRARGGRWAGIAVTAGVIGLACTRGASTTPPVDIEAQDETPTPARAEGETESRPAARISYDEGFDPPQALVRPPDPLDVSQLGEPEGVPASFRKPLSMPWSDRAELGAPPRAERIDTPPCRQQYYLAHETRPLRTVALEHDAQGRVVRERIDEDTDGTIDLERTYAWGPDDRLDSLRERHGPQPTCEGTDPAWVALTEHRYDAFGVWLGAQVHQDGESVSTEWRDTTYDAHGRPLRWVRYRLGEILGAEVQQWDQDGRLRSRTIYEAQEPVLTERWSYPSDTERYYAISDGQQWVVDRIVLDDQGRPAQTQRDIDGDGHVDEHTRFEHDEQGREVLRQTDDDRDGEVDRETRTRYDEAGRKVEVVRTGPEGTERESWRYDAQGRLLRWSSKLDEHWAEDFEEHRYDEQGHEVERRSERYRTVTSVSDLSGYVEREHWQARRDEQGRIVQTTVLEGELGPNERIEYVYQCRKPYQRHPRRNPLDHPETAAECFQDFE